MFEGVTAARNSGRMHPVSGGTWPLTDRRLSLITIMPQPSRSKAGKRKRPPEHVPSSLSLEVVSLVRIGSSRGRATKKRVIEKMEFDHPSSPITFPDDDNDDSPPAPSSQVDPPDSVDDDPAGLASDVASHSVSVSVLCARHLTRHPLTRSQSKVQEWLPHCSEFLHEILRTEAPLHRRSPCLACKQAAEHRCTCESAAEYRCLSCSSGESVCKGCLLSRHVANPLHRVQVCILMSITLTR